MLGVGNNDAGSDLVKVKKKKVKAIRLSEISHKLNFKGSVQKKRK